MNDRSLFDSQDGPAGGLAGFLWFCLAMIAGATVAFLIFPAEMLLGSPSYWENVLSDTTTGIVAYYEFVHDQWRWPILYTPLFDSPDGALIYYADPNPLLAILGKIAFKLTGKIYLYTGPWLLASYMLNAGFGVIILRHLRLGVLTALPASLLFVLMPEFLFRFPHLPLSGQFTIVASIYAYLRITSGVHRVEVVLWAIAIGLLTFVTPYILAMCVPLLFAALLDGAWRKRVSLPLIVVGMSILLLEVLLLAWVGGLLEGSFPRSGGFTDYSMNLLSPVWPQFSLLSWTPGFLLATPGQYEGYNYLGIGTLALIVLAVVFGRGDIWRLVRERPFYLLSLWMFFIYSLSSVVYLGYILLMTMHYEDFPVLSEITGILRAPGRFFWPVGYSWLIGAVVILHRSKLSRMLPAILATAVVAQAIELTPLYRNMQRGAAISQVADKSAIASAIDKHTELRFFPGFRCAKQGRGYPILAFQVVAAREGKPVNGVYLNRGVEDCDRHQAEVVADPFFGSTTANPLLILMKNSIEPGVLAEILKIGMECEETTETLLCQRSGAPASSPG